jgi:DNA invertase Pin-like site-specific DNA recombinase
MTVMAERLLTRDRVLEELAPALAQAGQRAKDAHEECLAAARRRKSSHEEAAELIQRALDARISVTEIAKQMNVSRQTIYNWMAKGD